MCPPGWVTLGLQPPAMKQGWTEGCGEEAGLMWEGRAQQHRPLGPRVLSGSLLAPSRSCRGWPSRWVCHTSVPLSQLPAEDKEQDICLAFTQGQGKPRGLSDLVLIPQRSLHQGSRGSGHHSQDRENSNQS